MSKNRIRNQNVFLGATGDLTKYNETSTAQLGYIFRRDGKEWQVVKLVDANAALGDVLYWKDEAVFEVTPTIGNSNRNRPAGVSPGVKTATRFIIIQKGGPATVKSESGTTGMQASAHTANNRAIGTAIGTANPAKLMGVYLADTAANLATIDLQLVDE